MSDILEYKGYQGKVTFHADRQDYFGQIDGITDLVTFEADNPQDIEREFHNAVDDYLSFCDEIGKTPESAYKGRIFLQISPILHQKLMEKANRENESIDVALEKAIKAYV